MEKQRLKESEAQQARAIQNEEQEGATDRQVDDRSVKFKHFPEAFTHILYYPDSPYYASMHPDIQEERGNIQKGDERSWKLDDDEPKERPKLGNPKKQLFYIYLATRVDISTICAHML
jgi:hypothetical protein